MEPTKPPSPVGKAPLSPEAKRQRYAEMRSRLGRSKIEVKCPEGIQAIWALKMNEYEMARMDWLGFKTVVEDMKPGAKKRFDAAGLRADGTYCLGDVILMEIDSETYALQKEIELDSFAEFRDGIPQEFQTNAAEQKVPTFEITEKGEKVFSKPGA
jgi:hypothetical protein